jgi:hypothetical protein
MTVNTVASNKSVFGVLEISETTTVYIPKDYWVLSQHSLSPFTHWNGGNSRGVKCHPVAQGSSLNKRGRHDRSNHPSPLSLQALAFFGICNSQLGAFTKNILSDQINAQHPLIKISPSGTFELKFPALRSKR